MMHVSDSSSASSSRSDLSPCSHNSKRTPSISSQPEHGQSSTPLPRPFENRALDSILGEWFSTSVNQDRYNSFCTQSISVCEKLDLQFFGSEQLAFIEKLAKDNCLLCELGDIMYPLLVRLFYANLEMKMDANGMYLASFVKSVPTTINRTVLATMFGLKFTNPAPPSLTHKVAKDICLTHYACPQKLAAYKCQNRTPPYHVPFPEPRLLHYFFVRIFYPKDHLKEAYNEVALESIYRLMDGYLVDYTSIIVSYMYRVANMSRPSSLPYGNVLTCTFTHFNVPFDLETLREDYAELRTQVDVLYIDMGLLSKKVDELIHMTCTIHHGA
ncbi:hypothetical protein Cgig2_015283 [Carnegiea gigantea]|uniref:Uncharacterized protein n=1 Tax=Carnegiea gigantea TaxID=171969 RepID=A0A9Q1K6Q7_9CARY|nr:hypothetical protein Cgig2_015283 [Carnegiea gigantea]